MKTNATKQRLLRGQPAVGALLWLGSPLAAEFLTCTGYDFLMVDAQHGSWDDYAALQALRAIAAGPATPMARVQKNDFYTIGRMLDRGALGIIVPMVDTPAEARAAAAAVRYPPRGRRSQGATLTAFHGADYGQWIDDEVFLAVQIESAEALACVDEILAVSGIDGCWIGPWDLSRSLGLDLRSSAGQEALEAAALRVLEACRRTGKIPGIYGGADPRRWLDLGFLFVTAGDDISLMQRGAADCLQLLGRPQPA